jgi:antibiotic biosynthesis monooxygenase (ABM) superfamily enzyme
MVLFSFKQGVTERTRDAVLDELKTFPSRFPVMQRFGLGKNISKRDQRFAYVMTIEFDNQEELEAYLDSAEHERFVTEQFRPNIEERAIASYRC